MMFNQKLVASLKANGKILREFKDTVYIPFGSEYSVLIKNLNTVRALVNVYIDGDNAVPGGLVINAGQEVDLERWIKNGNLSEGNKFKFIERTAGIEQHRGIKLEDGLIRVEFQFEKPQPRIDPYKNDFYRNDYYGPWLNGTICRSAGTLNNAITTYSTNINQVGIAPTASVNDVGITVPGSKSNQSFSTCSSFPLEPDNHCIVLKLLGETEENRAITQPITVKHKPKCITCGKQNKATAKFCSACGTALEIFA